jgi:hypothetical protein
MASRSLTIICICALSALIGGAPWAQPVAAQTQSLPPSFAPPGQMTPPDGVQSYPSTDSSAFSSPYPATSPSTYSIPAAVGPAPALPPYDKLPSIVSASAPSMVENASGPSFSGDPGAVFAPNNSGPLYTPHSSSDATAVARPVDLNSYGEPAPCNDEPWTWQILPTGLLYKLYLASDREPRLGSEIVHQRDQGWLWQSTIGARVGLVRYGTTDALCPQGWQLDVDAAAYPLLDADRNLVEGDYRAGIPLTTRQGPWELKVGYLHNCSHIGDLYLLAHPDFERINYVRDSIVWGVALYANPDLRFYTESNWAFHTDGGAEPWEFQFGADFVSATPTGLRGAPFFAINGHLREVNNFSGNMTVQTGWHWRGNTGHLLRIGVQYFNGMSEQGEFYNKFEEQIGGGLWYDF